jgi:hypothetical protein
LVSLVSETRKCSFFMGDTGAAENHIRVAPWASHHRGNLVSSLNPTGKLREAVWLC